MKKTFLAFSAALLILAVGIVGVRMLSQSSGDVQGVSQAPQTTEIAKINQDTRENTPIIIKSLYLENILAKVAEISETQTYELKDNSTFHWTQENDEMEVIGQSISLQNKLLDTENKIINLLKEMGFVENEHNLSSGSSGHATGFIKEQYVCILKSVFSQIEQNYYETNVNLELRCGEITLDN